METQIVEEVLSDYELRMIHNGLMFASDKTKLRMIEELGESNLAYHLRVKRGMTAEQAILC